MRRAVPLPAALREAIATPHLPGLDGLRMIAAFLVVFYHFGFGVVPGDHGVLAFFVLSGFLITWLLLAEEERHGAISLRLFYLRRALRIFPAFYAFWALWTALLLVFDKRIVWGQTWSAFAYLNNYYQAILGDPNTGYSHTWSLGIEEQFYLLWPMSLIALRRRPRIAIVAAAIGVIWVYRALLELVVGVNQNYVYEAFDTRADHLLIGCLLAMLLRGEHLGQLWRWLCKPFVSVVTLAVLIASIRAAQVFGAPYRNVIGFALDPLLVAVLIAQVLALSRSPLWSWLNWRWVRYLGLISYSVYLYQQVVIEPVRAAFAAYPLPVQLAGAVGVVVLVAACSYHVIERPFLRLKERIATRSTGARAPAVALAPSEIPDGGTAPMPATGR
jgi:peptidoglycan/LPS O-acetylase OafA/YrhL